MPCLPPPQPHLPQPPFRLRVEHWAHVHGLPLPAALDVADHRVDVGVFALDNTHAGGRELLLEFAAPAMQLAFDVFQDEEFAEDGRGMHDFISEHMFFIAQYTMYRHRSL